MLAACLCVSALVSALVLSYLIDDECPPLHRLTWSAALSVVLVALVGYPWVAWFSFSSITWVGLELCLLLPMALLQRPDLRRRLAQDFAPRTELGPPLLVLLAIAAALTTVFRRVIMLDPDGLFTGLDNNLGDLPFHLGLIMSFAVGQNYPPLHPELDGVRLTYPFLADFWVAVMVRGGWSVVSAVFVQNLTLGTSLVLAYHRFALALTGSRRAAWLAPALLLFSGGVGAFDLLAEGSRSPEGLMHYLMHLPHDCTLMGDTIYRWGNSITVLLIPQRTLLLGLPLGLTAWTLIWQALRSNGARARQAMIGSGVLVGLLPLAHAHTYLSSIFLGLCLTALFPSRLWLLWWPGALLLAAPQMFWATRGAVTRTEDFFDPAFGWDHGPHHVVWFWLVNTGLFIPVWLVSLVWLARVDRRLLKLQLPFASMFIVANLFKLSPWIWDNIKFLWVWYMGAVPAVAAGLAAVSRRGQGGRAVAGLLTVALILSGALDVWRVASGQLKHQLYDAAALEFARDLAAQTPPSARFLSAPVFNSPVLLSGRREYLGYPGHLWSQGFAYQQREVNLRAIYAGAPQASQLLANEQIDYLVLGPQEQFTLPVNLSFLQSYPVVLQTRAYRLYRIH